GGKPGPAPGCDNPRGSRVSAAQRWCGRDRIRTCGGEAGGFTGRTTVTSPVPSHPHLALMVARDVRKRPVDRVRHHLPSLPIPPCPARPGVGRREGGGNPSSTPCGWLGWGCSDLPPEA